MQGQISYLSRAVIDDQRWDKIILNSKKSSIYATTGWLDQFCPDWAALVINDYEHFLPLTFKKKCGIRYLVQPAFTQQTGIFTTTAISPTESEALLDALLKYSPYGAIAVNWDTGRNERQRVCTNFMLSLHSDYDSLRARYHPVLNKNLKKAARMQLQYESGADHQLPIRMFQKFYSRRLRLSATMLNRLTELTVNPPRDSRVFSRLVKNGTGNVVAAGLYFIYGKRIYNIISVTTSEGRQIEAARFLYDRLIREFSGQSLILDFEGGNIPGIAFFYRQFGAEEEPYYLLKWNRLKWPFRLILK